DHDQIWMGYERKRGKLANLNALLRGDSADVTAYGFSHLTGNWADLAQIEYVITLDRDTQMPRDAAWQLVATMAHPLNLPQYDPKKRRIVAGYGILQPRVAVSLPLQNTSMYAKLYGGINGIDPYTLAVSDVYQDLFLEGSFIGKGIYDVDAFELAINGGFPENSILSHDLLEGCHARAGLVSDVQLYEEYPTHYRADVSRRYRWIRGDWQLAGWLFRHSPCKTDTHLKNPLSMLSQWKVIDNLRRSIVPPALLVLLVLSWSLSFAWQGTVSVLLILLLAPLLATLMSVLSRAKEVLWQQHLLSVLETSKQRLLQSTFEIACLPYQAFYSVDAIVRTIWRMSVTHQKLLEWNPSTTGNEVAIGQINSHQAYWRSMWIGPA
ncbi:MAG: cyclic beta 1-2 glucan synthetase, partial [Deefgea sp.]